MCALSGHFCLSGSPPTLFGISIWFGLQMASNDPDPPDLSTDPQPGDLIEIFRPAYQHWALYLGDGYIINLTPVGQCQVNL